MATASDNVVILSYARTPMGAMQGALADVSATDLGATAVKAAVERAGVEGGDIDRIYMGCVLPAGLGQAPARQAAIKAGLPTSVQATTVNEGIRITNSSGEINAETTNGNIFIDNATTSNLEAFTVNGEVTFNGTIRDNGVYKLGTHNGDIRVGLGSANNATIFVRTFQGDFAADFAFTRAVGEAFLAAFPPIVRRRMGLAWTDAEMEQLLEFRGRYVEFNLLYDRGTLFGLKTNGNTDAILMSLPPLARWK